jgi:hypothetical protein
LTRRQGKPAVPVLLARIVAGTVVAGTVVAGTVACSSGGGQPVTIAAGGAHGSGSPSPASAAAVMRAGEWLTGPSEKLLGAVNANVVGVSEALLHHQHGPAVTIPGRRLATAAKAALDGPAPPLDAGLYRSGLTDLSQAGTDAAGGHTGAVEPLLTAGITEITKVTAAADLVAPTGHPPGSGDPS